MTRGRQILDYYESDLLAEYGQSRDTPNCAEFLASRLGGSLHKLTGSRAPDRESESARGAWEEPAAIRQALASARRIRQATAGSLFPAEEAGSPGWLLTLIAVGCAVLAVARQGSAGLNTIFAEDGQVFYHGALTNPLHTFVEPWAGYWEAAPRIIAIVVSLFPVNWAAAAIAVADAIVMGLLAALVYRACGEHIRNPWLRAIPAIATAAYPVGQETWGAITNLQWPMYFVAIIVLLWNPRRLVPIAVGSVMVVLLTLTSPFGLLLVPIAVVRLAALGGDRGSVIPLATLAGVALQTTYMAIVGGRQTYSAIHLGMIEKFYEERVAGQGFFGIRYVLPWRPLGGAVMIAALAALVLVAASGRPRQFALAALALVYSVGYFTVLIILSGLVNQGSDRYNVGSFLLLAYAVTVLLDSVLRGGAALWTSRIRTAAQRRLAGVPRFAALLVCAALAGCLAWSVTTSWNVTHRDREHPTWSGALASASAECSHGARTAWIPITPSGALRWHVTLTCSELGN